MNVLLVVLDTVRARNMSLYGHQNETTPFLESFADRATVYTQARAPAARSLDSHVSIFTGLHVDEHRVTQASDKLRAGETIFDELRNDGYATGVFTENSWLTDVDAGLRDPFDHRVGPQDIPFPDALDPTAFVVEEGQGKYTEFVRTAAKSESPLKSAVNGLAVKIGSDYPNLLPGQSTTPASVYVDRFLEWSADHDRWAACLNLMDAHHPYEPAAEYDQWGGDRLRDLQNDIEDVKWEFNAGDRPWWQRRALEGLYDGAIHQIDSELERLISRLQTRGELDETLVVVLSDHGEGFGEVSRIRPTRIASHSLAAHEVLLHVPLIVKYPAQTEGKRIDGLSTLTGFPAAVKAAREGDGVNANPFLADDNPVVATVHGLDTAVRERASRYCDDLTPYTETVRVAYTSQGEEIRKAMTWRDEAVEIAIPDAQTAYQLTDSDDRSTKAAETVSDTFAPLEDHETRESGSGVDELDDAAHQRLEDLGYV